MVTSHGVSPDDDEGDDSRHGWKIIWRTNSFPVAGTLRVPSASKRLEDHIAHELASHSWSSGGMKRNHRSAALNFAVHRDGIRMNSVSRSSPTWCHQLIGGRFGPQLRHECLEVFVGFDAFEVDVGRNHVGALEPTGGRLAENGNGLHRELPARECSSGERSDLASPTGPRTSALAQARLYDQRSSTRQVPRRWSVPRPVTATLPRSVRRPVDSPVVVAQVAEFSPLPDRSWVFLHSLLAVFQGQSKMLQRLLRFAETCENSTQLVVVIRDRCPGSFQVRVLAGDRFGDIKCLTKRSPAVFIATKKPVWVQPIDWRAAVNPQR